MGDNSKIEWLARPGTKPATWNPFRARNRAGGKVGWFCVHKSPGCVNCYAEAWNQYRGTGVKFKAQNEKLVDLFVDDKTLEHPTKWQAPRTVFVCSMTDLFGEFHEPQDIARVFAVMARTPRHTYIVVTKRAERMASLMNSKRFQKRVEAIRARSPAPFVWPLPNVWCLISAEDQRTWDQRSRFLRKTPAVVRGASFEPLLGPIGIDYTRPFLQWAIIGGESGPSARDCDIGDIDRLVHYLNIMGTAVFIKQLGRKPISADGFRVRLNNAKGADVNEWPEHLVRREFPA